MHADVQHNESNEYVDPHEDQRFVGGLFWFIRDDVAASRKQRQSVCFRKHNLDGRIDFGQLLELGVDQWHFVYGLDGEERFLV